MNILENKINDDLSEKSQDSNDVLKKFLVEKVLDDQIEENKKIKKAILENIDLDMQLETALNKEHLTNFLTKMKEELDKGYTSAYNTWGKALTFGVQSALVLAGFDIGTEQIDGMYGPKTVEAVKQFQAWKRIAIDGSAGPETVGAMLTNGFDAKITDEEKKSLDITVTSKKQAKEAANDFYSTHESTDTITYGTEINKIYKVAKVSDVPTEIEKNTIIDVGPYYFFSNSKVYEYGPDGKTLIRRGDRSEIDVTTGTWKVAIKPDIQPTTDSVKNNQEVVDNSVKEQTATYEQLQLNITKIWEKSIVGYTHQWQKDWLKSMFPNGIALSFYGGGLAIQKPSNTTTIFTLPYTDIGGNKEEINVKKFVEGLRGKLSETMDKDHDSKLIDTYLEGKTFLWNTIFTDADFKDPVMKSKIDLLKTLFKKSNAGKGDGIDISDVSVKLNKKGAKEIKIDLDNDGSDNSWNANYTFIYNEIFPADGSFNKGVFTQKMRSLIVNHLFNSTKYTKMFTNLNPLDI